MIVALLVWLYKPGTSLGLARGSASEVACNAVEALGNARATGSKSEAGFNQSDGCIPFDIALAAGSSPARDYRS